MANEILDIQALNCCLLIDSRFSSRGETRAALKASALFENIIEPESVDHSIRLLSELSVAACLIGTSVTPTVATRLVDQSRGSLRSPHCAFLYMISPAREQLMAEGSLAMHSLIPWPCAPQEFVQGIVNGVVNADPQSIWRSHSTIVPPQQAPEFLDPNEPNVSQKFQPASIVEPTAQSEFALRDLAKLIASGDCGLDASGRPTPKSVVLLHSIVIGMLGDRAGELAKDPLVRMLEQLIERWMVDYIRSSPQAATRQLRRSLVRLGANAESDGASA